MRSPFSLRVSAVIAAALVIGGTCVQAIELKQIEFLGQPALAVENDFYRLTISPGHGGRIVSWVDKEPRRPDGEFVYFTPQNGGLLDDRGPLTTARYEYEVVKQTSAEISVKLWAKESSGIVREKTITGYDQNRALRVVYRLVNRTRDPIEPSRIMFKNHVRPSVSQDKPPRLDGYSFFTPLTTGVRESLFPAIKHGVGLNSYRYENVAAGWHGQLDKESRDGIAITFDQEAIHSAYYWMKTQRPWNTYEWSMSMPRLSVGDSWETSFLYVMQRGLAGYTDVTEDYIAYLEPTVEGRKASFALSLMPVMEPLDLERKPLVHTEIRNLKDETIAKLPALQFPRIWVKETATSKNIETRAVSWDADREGTLVVWQQVKLGDEVAGEYELPFVVGEPRGEYVRGGIKRKPKEVAYELDEGDFKRGYLTVWRTRTGPVQDVQVVQLDVGANERETVQLEIIPMREIGSVKLTTATPRGPSELPAPDVSVRQVESGQTEVEKYGLRRTNDFAASPGQTTDVFLTFRFRGDTKPGDYTAELTLTPDHAPPKVVSFEIKVWPVRIAEPRMSRMLAYWEAYIIFRETRPKSPDDAVRIFEPYARDLAEAGVRTINLFGRHVWKTRRKDGQPGYDYSRLCPLLAVAKRHGFDSAWLTGSAPGLPEYLHSQGLRRVYFPTLDECPLKLPEDRLDKMNRQVEDEPSYYARHAALSPVSVGLINDVQKFIKTWSFGGRLVYSVLQWQKAGKVRIPPEEEVGFYGGGAYGYRVPYVRAIRNGWTAGWLDCDHWTLYCYLRDRPPGKPWRSVFVTRGGPVSTSGWEGFKDGNDCFEYLKMAHAAARDFEAKGDREAAQQIQARLGQIIGSADACPIQTQSRVADGMSLMTLEGDLADFLAAKRMVLRLLTDISATP